MVTPTPYLSGAYMPFGLLPIIPNTKGLPGFMAGFQNLSHIPDPQECPLNDLVCY